MATFVSDTFTDADSTSLESHIGETGATWTRHPSYTAAANSLITGNRVRESDAANTATYYASGLPATAEYDVQATLRKLDSRATFSRIIGRLSTSADTCYLANYRHDVEEFRLFRVEAGTFTQIGSFAQSLTIGQDYVVKLEIRDAAKKVYIDGVERISSSDNVVTAAGRAGIALIGDATGANGYHWDSFTAVDAAVASAVNLQVGLFGMNQVGLSA